MIVYRHIRLDKNEPFYIGIGKKKERAYRKDGRNSLWNKIINKTDYKVQILFEDVAVEFAKEKEKELIELYGRISLGSGILANLTEGGDNIECPQSKRDKLRIANLGKKHSEETKLKISQNKKGYKYSEEAKRNMSLSMIGLKRSQEAKDKMSKKAFELKNSYDHNIYRFINLDTGVIEESTRNSFEQKYGHRISEMSCIVQRKAKTHLRWYIDGYLSEAEIYKAKNRFPNSACMDIVTFKNKYTGEEIDDYLFKFVKEHNLLDSLMRKVLNKKRTHHGGWQIIKVVKEI
jgi:hypothetical protein